MKTFIIILIGIMLTYLTCVGIYNEWDFISSVAPTEFAKRVGTALVLFLIYSAFSWIVITGIIES